MAVYPVGQLAIYFFDFHHFGGGGRRGGGGGGDGGGSGAARCFQNGSERTNHLNGLKYIFLYLTTAPKQYLIPEFLKPGHKVCLIIHFV